MKIKALLLVDLFALGLTASLVLASPAKHAKGSSEDRPQPP